MSAHSRNEDVARRAVEIALGDPTLVRRLVRAFAQAQHDVISEQTQERIAHHRAAGTWVNPAKVLISDAAVARIVELRAQGMSQRGIARQLEADGLPAPRGGQSWCQQTVRKTLLRLEREATS